MKNHLLAISIFALSLITFCIQKANSQTSDVEVWKLGWRMIANSMEENYEMASLQFDSLLNQTGEMEKIFLVKGLEVKSKLNENETILEILNTQDEATLSEICTKQFLANMKPCMGLPDEKIEQKKLQIELIKMYVDDQAARGNMKEDLILKYNLDTSQITKNGSIGVGEHNRNRLKEIVEEYGFPNRKLVGKDAMFGIFIMIQHADSDQEWQKSQLKNIEAAVKNGDLDGQSYAYLYDRIKINGGEKQLYGTQFAKVDPINKIVELAETEDIENLDNRRKEFGMMPIEMYKQFVLKNL